jgi:hypothetical protein
LHEAISGKFHRNEKVPDMKKFLYIIEIAGPEAYFPTWALLIFLIVPPCLFSFLQYFCPFIIFHFPTQISLNHDYCTLFQQADIKLCSKCLFQARLNFQSLEFREYCYIMYSLKSTEKLPNWHVSNWILCKIPEEELQFWWGILDNHFEWIWNSILATDWMTT